MSICKYPSPYPPPPPYLPYSYLHPALPVAFPFRPSASSSPSVHGLDLPRPTSSFLVSSRLCSFHHVLGVCPKKTRCSHILIPIFLFPSPSYPLPHTSAHPHARAHSPVSIRFRPPTFLFACLTFPPIARPPVLWLLTPWHAPSDATQLTHTLVTFFLPCFVSDLDLPTALPCPALPCVGVLASLFPFVLPIAVLVFPPPCRNTLFVLSIHTTQHRQRLFPLSYISLYQLSRRRA